MAGSLAFTALFGAAATRPRYGGTLRARIQAQLSSLEPADAPGIAEASALRKLRSLVYEGLVRLDAAGHAQPALAISWEHDAQFATWRFKLRPGVKWQDGAALTPEEIVANYVSLIPGHPARLEGDTLVFETGESQPEFPITLASARDPGVRREASPSSPAGPPLGTGPFRLAEWQAGRRAVLQANEDYWDGRPFLDAVSVEMGGTSRDRLIDLELDKADLVELNPAEARHAQQEGKKVWNSAPVELLSLRFNANRPGASDQRVREAIAVCIDRAAIQRVLLQNFGEVAGGIFPQWLSGFSFLFSTAPDLAQARKLRAEIASPPSLKLGFNPEDVLARQVAERVAVNARDAGLIMQVSPLPQGWRRMADPGVEVWVERARIEGPTLESAVLQAAQWLPFPTQGMDGPEEVFGAERKLLETFALVPIVCAPELVGLGTHVRNWSATRWGDWQLENVWLETEKP